MFSFHSSLCRSSTHHNCTSTYQNYHTTSIPAGGGRLTQVLHTSSDFFGCLVACITYLLSRWSHFIYSHDNTIGLGEQWDYLSTFPRSLVLFPILLHNSHLPVNWGGCYSATDGWQARPGGCAARAALGILQREQQTPSNLLARASCFWFEGWWILRPLRLEAIPLGVMYKGGKDFSFSLRVNCRCKIFL